MKETLGTAQVCPTRIDGETALFAHQVTRSQCQTRQRECFHKCFTCAHNNAYVAANGKPVEASPARKAVRAKA